MNISVLPKLAKRMSITMTKGTLFIFIIFQFIIALMFFVLGFILCYHFVVATPNSSDKLMPKYSEFCIPNPCKRKDDTFIKGLDKIDTAPMPKPTITPPACAQCPGANANFDDVEPE